MSLRAKVVTVAVTVVVAAVVVTASAPSGPASPSAPALASVSASMPVPATSASAPPPTEVAAPAQGAAQGAAPADNARDPADLARDGVPATVVESSPPQPSSPPVVPAPTYVTSEHLLPSGRSYVLRTVVGPGPRRPLVVLLHGLGLDPVTMEQMTGAARFADEHGFALAYGIAVDKAWNAGTCCRLFRGDGSTAPADDLAYLRELVAHASATTAVDRRRIYAWGYSNGGMMAWRAVCEAGDLFAAAGVVGGQLTAECGTSTVAAVHVHGLADTTVPWRGGWSEFLDTYLPDGLLEAFRVGPGSIVEHLTWDGGHSWPEWAVEALWEFSSRYTVAVD